MMRLRIPVTERDHIRGPADAPLTLVEYGDYQCPFCGQFYWVERQLELRMGHDLRFVYRHFPLAEIHPMAVPAAEVAEAAAGQNAFWAMHGALFEHQDQLDMPHMLGFAEQLGLVLDWMADDLESETHLPRIRDDFNGGVRSGVNGTPCLFINDVRHDGSWDLETLVDALAQARGNLPQRPHVR
jgi:protein-disulfide isomerase